MHIWPSGTILFCYQGHSYCTMTQERWTMEPQKAATPSQQSSKHAPTATEKYTIEEPRKWCYICGPC